MNTLSQYKVLVSLVLWLCCLVAIDSVSAQDNIKVMSFNILEGGKNGLDKVFQVITDYDPDIVLIQEVNTSNTDFEDMATTAGYTSVIVGFGPGSAFGGPALITKLPIIQSEIYYDLATVQIDLGSGISVMANSTHLPPVDLGYMRLDLARHISHEYLRVQMEEFPVIFGGDLNIYNSNTIMNEFTNIGMSLDASDNLDHILSHGLTPVPGTTQVIGPNIYGSEWPSDHNAVYIEYYKPSGPIVQESSSTTITNQVGQSYNFSAAEIQGLVALTNFSSVEMVSLPTRGNLLLNGNPVFQGQYLNVSDFDNLSYVNLQVGRDGFEWKAYDNLNNPARTSSYFYIKNDGYIKDLEYDKLYQNVEILQTGVSLYTGDSDYLLSTSEPDLLGNEFIRFPTYYSLFNHLIDDYYSVNLDNNGTIYIAFDDRFQDVPGWIINNFILTDISFVTNEQSYKVYEKTVSSGPFTFGSGTGNFSWDKRLLINPPIIITIPNQTHTFVPDDNFEQALIDLGYDSGPLDDYVPYANINTITTLDVSNESIGSLIGIEDFDALTTLNCSNNLLTSLDVSENVLLTNLICSNNQIILLDLRENSDLLQLHCNNNQLKILNVDNGNNTNMANADFNTTNNPSLTCIQVDDVAWSTANWTNIDGHTGFNEKCFTFVPDDNFEQALIDLGYDSGPLDNFVPYPNISSVTSLNVGNKGIIDLKGIEDFTALISLQCSWNDLVYLDVSNNTALEVLDCSTNELYNLDLSQNLALTNLSCGSNSLVSLDLSANSNLTYLYAAANFLSELDLSQNTALTYLNCQTNQLKSLNVKNDNNKDFTFFRSWNNRGLKCIEVDDAEWSTANWTQKDSSSSFAEQCNTYVPDNNFEQALINLGYDTGSPDFYVPTLNIEPVLSLDVSALNIFDLTGIENFKSLSNLNCSNNLINKLILSRNTALTELRCNNNNLEILDLKNGNNTSISDANFDSSGNPGLICIQVDDATWSTANWTNIDIQTSFNEHCYTYVPDDNFEQELVNLGHDSGDLDDYVPLVNINGIITLDLSSKSISDLTGIEDFMALESLNISNNLISQLDLDQNTALTYLNCSQNTLKEFTIKNGNNNAITDANFIATNNPDLSCIDVDDPGWSTSNWTNIDGHTGFAVKCRTYVPDDAFELALIDLGYDSLPLDDHIPTPNIASLTSLDLTGRAIKDVTGIEDFTALTFLNLYNNQLTQLDVSKITALETLRCGINQLSAIDLSDNVALLSLSIRYNQLISIDLSQNTLLTDLNCEFNQLTSLDLSANIALTSLCARSNMLTELDLSTNSNLALLLVQSNQLTKLNVKNGNNTIFNYFNTTGNTDLYCILVDDAAYSTSNWLNIDGQTNFSDTDCNSKLSSKVFFQGPYDTSTALMKDDLRTNMLLPTTSPYEDGLSANQSVLDVTGPEAIIDWIWMELRDSSDGTTVVDSRSALLQADGDIVDIDGVSNVTFENIPVGNYFLMVGHRNHVGALTSDTVGLINNIMQIDLTNDSGLITGGTNGIADMGDGNYALYAGDVSGNGQVQNSDIAETLPLIGTSGYSNGDIDMNGQVQNTDIQNMIYPNIGKGEQNASRKLNAKRSSNNQN